MVIERLNVLLELFKAKLFQNELKIAVQLLI